MSAIKKGDIIIFNSTKGGWFSSCQRFFTGLPYTHAAVCIGDVLTHPSIIEADLLVEVTPLKKTLDDTTKEYEAYRPNLPLPEWSVDTVLGNIYYNYTNNEYGFTQVLWFVYRWFMEKFLHKDVRKKNNPFSKGVICSELVFYYLAELSEHSKPLSDKISEWNPDTVHAGDIANICKQFFTKIEEYKINI